MALFHFHNHLPVPPVDRMHDWALIIAMHDRLTAHGIEVSIYQAPRGHQPELALKSGVHWLSTQGDLPQSFPDSVELKSVMRERIFNAASWRALDPDSLKDLTSRVSDEISLAIDYSILHWQRGAKNSGADASLEARLYAAREQGYDIHTIHYHETDRENKASLMKNGFDFQRVSARARDTMLPDGAFFKPTSETVDISKDPVQIPFLLKKGLVKQFADREALLQHHQTIPGLPELQQKVESADAFWGEKTDALLKKLQNTPSDSGLQSAFKKALDDWREEIGQLGKQIRETLSLALKQEGVRYIRVANDKGSHGRSVDSTVALYPEDICGAEMRYLPTPKVIRPAPADTKPVTPILASTGTDEEHLRFRRR